MSGSSLSSVEVLVVLPLRLASQRIPRKILQDIEGASLGGRTIARTLEAFHGEPRVHVCVAVDSEESKRAFESELGSEVSIYLTDPELPSGTDRVSVAVSIFRRQNPKARLKGILNVQGDMPFVGIAGLVASANYYLGSSAEDLEQVGMITLSQAFPKDQDYDDVGAVKVITDRDGRAIYFSRYPIPYSRVEWPRGKKAQEPALGDLHIGVYGYTSSVLARFCGHAPVGIEKCESLEQLRALWLGIPILVIPTDVEEGRSYRGIDTPNDLKWARAFARKALKTKAPLAKSGRKEKSKKSSTKAQSKTKTRRR